MSPDGGKTYPPRDHFPACGTDALAFRSPLQGPAVKVNRSRWLTLAMIVALCPRRRLLDLQQALVPFVMLLQAEKVGRGGRKVRQTGGRSLFETEFAA